MEKFSHQANAQLRDEVSALLLDNGYSSLVICTPEGVVKVR